MPGVRVNPGGPDLPQELTPSERTHPAASPTCGLTLTGRPGLDRMRNRADAPLSRADADEATRVVVRKECIERRCRTLLLSGRGSGESDDQNAQQNESGSHTYPPREGAEPLLQVVRA